MEAMDKKNQAILQSKTETKHISDFSYGDTVKQLLARSRYTI
jgi:hypothetical protein